MYMLMALYVLSKKKTNVNSFILLLVNNHIGRQNVDIFINKCINGHRIFEDEKNVRDKITLTYPV